MVELSLKCAAIFFAVLIIGVAAGSMLEIFKVYKKMKEGRDAGYHVYLEFPDSELNVRVIWLEEPIPPLAKCCDE